MEELGGAKIHSEVSGVTDLVAKSDDECLLAIRKLLGFLPSNFESMPPRKTTNDDPARSVEALEKIVPEDMTTASALGGIIPPVEIRIAAPGVKG